MDETSFTTRSLILAAKANIARLETLVTPQARRVQEDLGRIVRVLENWDAGQIHPSAQERSEILDQLIELNRKAHALLL